MLTVPDLPLHLMCTAVMRFCARVVTQFLRNILSEAKNRLFFVAFTLIVVLYSPGYGIHMPLYRTNNFFRPLSSKPASPRLKGNPRD